MKRGECLSVSLLCSIFVILCRCGQTLQESTTERLMGQSKYREAYFDGTGYIRLLTTISFRSHTGLSFRTCDGGELFSQTRNDTIITLSVHSEDLRLVVTTPVKRFETIILAPHETFLDNRWHSVNLVHRFRNLTLNIDGHSQVVANETFNSELLTNPDLEKEDAILIIGKNYRGCILEGPSLVLDSYLMKPHHVLFGPCAMSPDSCTMRQDMVATTSPVSPAMAVDYCSNVPCLMHGVCISHADRYECKCTARYSNKNCELDLGPPCTRPGFVACQNDATCTEDATGDYTCTCPPGFTGERCELELTVHPVCEKNPCLNQGTCKVPAMSHDYQCDCVQGYSGRNCELNINECVSNPCQNNGKCIDDVNNYTCVCSGTGYRGRHCEVNINECEAAPCQHLGICFDTYGSYTCHCQPGFDGINCEIDINECALSPCKNNGVCVDQVGSYECHCMGGYTGVHCETKLTPCAGVQCPPYADCVEVGNSYHCLCKPSYLETAGPSPNCTESLSCIKNPCVNAGTCVPLGDTFRCICAPNFTGSRCEHQTLCMTAPCLNGGTCTEMGQLHFLCTCAPGFTGNTCQNAMVCDDLPCLHATSCQDYTAGYYCSCKSGWTGHNCNMEIDECMSKPCRNGGICYDSLNTFLCKCPHRFTGKTCQLELEGCASAPCLNGGHCFDQGNGYNCTCTDMWMGSHCEKPFDACKLYRPCQNNGTCVTDALNKHKHSCNCVKGFEGTNCETNIYDCLGITCPPYQVCIDGVNSYECRCPIGYGGENCATVIASCDTPGSCLNGTCVPTADGFTCECTEGFKGVHCEEDIDECSENVAICNNGICVNGMGGFECYCRPGYTGNRCDQDFDECLSQPCKNGATCINKINNFECQCTPGYTSKDCSIDVDECESNPCTDGSTCVDGIASFSCLCQPGLTGERCDVDIDDCESSPCLHQGLCIDGLNSYLCDCNNTGFVGDHCQDNIDDCLSNPCQNGAQCVDGVNDYTCACYPGYTGKNCETDMDECLSNPCKNFGTCLQKSNTALYDEEYQAVINFTLPSLFHNTFSYNSSDGYVCVCLPGIIGDFCETNVNECDSNPCFNGGQCTDRIGNYTCDCDDGFEGGRCEHEIDECLRHKPCVHGTCIDKRANYFCECKLGYGGKNCSVELTGCSEKDSCLNNGTCIPYLENEIYHKFNCSCVYGYHGNICEKVTTMSINGSSYVVVNTTRDEGYDIQFRFKTTLANGLLAIGNGLTYYILELVHGRLNLHSSLLNKWEGVFIGSGLNDSKWQKVFVAINSSHLVLAANEEQTIYPINILEGSNATHTSFPTTYLGGTLNRLRHLAHVPTFFVGCTQDVVINGEWVLPQPVQTIPMELVNIEVGCQREPQCQPNPCHSGGHCKDLWQTFSCSCKRPYLGHTCQYNYTAATFGNENITNSLVTVAVTDIARRAVRSIVHISMFIRTRENKGQIFYLGSPITSSMDGTYVAAQLEAGELLVRIQFGTPEAYTVSGVHLDNGYNHLIEVSRNVTLVQVKLNGTEYFRKTISAVGQLDVQKLYLGGLPQVSRPVRQADAATGPGGTSSAHRAELNTSVDNFKGIIQDVQISNGTRTMVVEFFPLEATDLEIPMPFGEVNFDPNSVLKGIVSDKMCKLNPCQHSGTCYNTWNDYGCHCPVGYKGKTCDEVEFCQLEKCPSGSECHNLNNGYECVANATFNGKTTSLIYSYSNLNETQTLFDTIELNYRSNTGGTLFYTQNGSEYFTVSAYKDQISVGWKLLGISGHHIFKKTPADGNWTTILFNITNDVIKGGFKDWMTDDTPNFVGEQFNSEAFTKLIVSSNLVVGRGFAGFDSERVVEYHEQNLTTTSRISDSATTENALLGNSVDVPVVVLTTENPMYDTKFAEHFKGCLGEIRIGNLLLPYFTIEELYANNVSSTEYFALMAEPTREPVGCVLCFDTDCENEGTCRNEMTEYSCKCKPGFEGDTCAVNINECNDNKCQNNSTCIDGVANYTCSCPLGWEGWLCDIDIDECLSDPCFNGGICNDLLGSFECICPDAYTGSQCQVLPLITCENNPCRNGSKCEDTKNPQTGKNFTCECAPGFTEELCDVPFCEKEPCKNGKCLVEEGKTPVCECNRGFTGHFCEEDINDCVLPNGESPCQHGGTCIDGIEKYTCECAETGYKGLLCEYDIDECKEIPRHELCGGSGQCINIDGSYRCNCTQSLCGRNCNIINPCFALYEDSPGPLCGDHGICNETCDLEPSFKCECHEGFYGPNCTREEEQIERSTGAIDIAIIVVPIIIVLLLIGAAGLAVLVGMARSKRATRGTYSPSAQEFCNPRVEMDHVLKPPPEERLI